MAIKKLYIALALASIITIKSYSQDSLSYKLSIDSLLTQNLKEGHKRMSVSNKTTKDDTLYYFNKKSKQITYINLISLRSKTDKLPWELNYYFINGSIVLIRWRNSYPINNKKRQIAYYYLKNGAVV